MSCDYHCYLLKSLDPSHPYKTYIGFTTNPERRLRQHNGILKHGGAVRTKRSGRPWEFAVIISGFTDKICALQFEWAWQHPHKSRHVKKIINESNESLSGLSLFRKRGIIAKLNILRLLLTKCICFQHFAFSISFFHTDWKDLFVSLCEQNGSFLSSSIDYQITSISTFQKDIQKINRHQSNIQTIHKTNKCHICHIYFTEIPIICSKCYSTYHVHCLANFILEHSNSKTSIIPKQGFCPCCQTTIVWANVMSERKHFKINDSNSISSSIINTSHTNQNKNNNSNLDTYSTQKNNSSNDQNIIVLSDSSISSLSYNHNDGIDNDQISFSSPSQYSIDYNNTHCSIDKCSFQMDHYSTNETSINKNSTPIKIIDLLETSSEDEFDNSSMDNDSYNSTLTLTDLSHHAQTNNNNSTNSKLTNKSFENMEHSIIVLSDDSTH